MVILTRNYDFSASRYIPLSNAPALNSRRTSQLETAIQVPEVGEVYGPITANTPGMLHALRNPEVIQMAKKQGMEKELEGYKQNRNEPICMPPEIADILLNQIGLRIIKENELTALRTNSPKDYSFLMAQSETNKKGMEGYYVRRSDGKTVFVSSRDSKLERDIVVDSEAIQSSGSSFPGLFTIGLGIIAVKK